jgi:hypothetical protein
VTAGGVDPFEGGIEHITFRIGEHKIALLNTGRQDLSEAFSYHALLPSPLDRIFPCSHAQLLI